MANFGLGCRAWGKRGDMRWMRGLLMPLTLSWLEMRTEL
ncbi:hypothetical protein SAMN05216411_102323 [Nitrosospira multiformis]|nr:hypothetical protein SAMN05216411_102323 [Nitrosospira multiformis]